MALTKHPIADLIARRGGLVIDGAMSTPLEAAIRSGVPRRFWSVRIWCAKFITTTTQPVRMPLRPVHIRRLKRPLPAKALKRPKPPA